ncbi:hypothetical protein [Aurantiacibacter spongiae]|uniref:Uncharacterized protein n=1 Tax=Aurantiacibacter spongiae TaxID=2488860 RepID=A0A3N5DIV0_9SPHN|nr:hypothetical protein [Aurantiacibacter spongiae]RPF70575.1 hypothetical protein EG799_02255 [Aurantiacibacter spongiae]
MESEESRTGLRSDRRSFLAACGKYSATVPPAMTILLSTSLSSPAIAKSGGGNNGKGHGTKGNNGVGNGIDPAPPGNPPMNDGPGSSPGNPGRGRVK